MVPPSTSTSPWFITGGSTPGIATDARSQRHNRPRRCTSECPGGEIRGDTEKRQRQILDRQLAELAVQQLAHTPPEVRDTTGNV